MDDIDNNLPQQPAPAAANGTGDGEKRSPWHPTCGKEYPAGDRTGHCASCCETFYGSETFDSHRRGEPGPERHCINPAAEGGLWRMDDRGRWHYGERLTSEQLARLVGSRGGVE